MIVVCKILLCISSICVDQEGGVAGKDRGGGERERFR
jgi:hypothetical protein